MSLHELRRTIPDATLLDWLELAEEMGETFTTREVQDLWLLSQPAVSRRINRLRRAGLIEHLRGGGAYGGHMSVWRLACLPCADRRERRGLERLDVSDAGCPPPADPGAAAAGDRGV
ncbi:MAG: MarR family transcriptional regulator [Vulcanococcus sp.]